MKIPKTINPIARAMLRLRKSPQVIPNKKKDRYPDVDDYDGVYIDMFTGKVKYLEEKGEVDMHQDEITLTEEDWDNIRTSLPLTLNNEDILMILLSILLQYIESEDDSLAILKDCIDNLPNAYQYNVNIKSRMH